MVDLVGTCPKGFWREWLEEGDAAGDGPTGETWGWFTHHTLIRKMEVGDRFYVVAHGALRGYALVTGFETNTWGSRTAILRRGGAVAVTIDETIPGFRGLRVRWWPREAERPFPDWKTWGVQ